MLYFDFVKSFPSLTLQVKAEVTKNFVALFGHSGAGKTTTLHVISGLLAPDRGEIRLNDRCLFSSERKLNLPTQQREVGLVFQESRLFPHLNVAQNLRLGETHARQAEARIRFEDLVEVLQLAPLLQRMPDTCSGGERQRIALGRALLAAPEYLLLDEPLVAVDLPERWRILKALRQVQSQYELPVLYVSHDAGMVLNFAEQMIVLRNGSVTDSGDPLVLFRRFVANSGVASVENLFKGSVQRKESGSLVVKVGDFILQTLGFSANVGDTIYLQIPAEEVILALEEPHGLSARNVLPGVVQGWKEIDGKVLVEVAVSSERLLVEILPMTVGKMGLQPGKRIYAIVKATGIRRV